MIAGAFPSSLRQAEIQRDQGNGLKAVELARLVSSDTLSEGCSSS